MTGLRINANLHFVFACNVPPNGVVACKGARAEGTGHSYALMALPYVRAQICLVAVQAIAVQTLQFFA